MKVQRLYLLCIAFFGSCLLMVSCGSLGSASLRSPITLADASGPSPLQMGCSYDWPGWWPWAVAQQQGLLEADAVELRWFDDYYAALAEMQQGKLDANCQVLNDTVEVAGQAVNGEVVVLVTDNSAGNDKIVVAKEIQTVADLVGQRVGVEKGKLTDFLLSLALENAGIEREDLEILYLETRQAANEFLADRLDAVVAWHPDWLDALRRPASHELLTSKDLPGAIPQVLAVSEIAIAEKTEAVQSLVNAWFETLQFMEANPAVAKPILRERSRLSKDEFRLFTKGVRLFGLPENRRAFQQGNSLESLAFTAGKAAEFSRESRQLSGPVDLEEMFSDRFIQAAE